MFKNSKKFSEFFWIHLWSHCNIDRQIQMTIANPFVLRPILRISLNFPTLNTSCRDDSLSITICFCGFSKVAGSHRTPFNNGSVSFCPFGSLNIENTRVTHLILPKFNEICYQSWEEGSDSLIFICKREGDDYSGSKCKSYVVAMGWF